MFVEYQTLEGATLAALQLAERMAYPILIHKNVWGNYRIGSRVEKEQQQYGEHVRTVHRSGSIENCGLTPERMIDGRITGNPPCLCLHGEALSPYINQQWRMRISR
jgi:hypothetical protein